MAWRSRLLLLLLASVPLLVGGYARYVATLWLIYAISGVGLQIPIGLASLYSFGHGAFMLIGAYSLGLLITVGHVPVGWAIPLGVLIGVASSMIVGAALALTSLRLSSFALAIVTIGAASLLFQAVKSFEFTGGPQGLFLPQLELVKWFDGRVFYLLVLALTVIGAVVSNCVAQGRIGRALRASAANALMAQSFGVNLLRIRTLGFVLSAIYGSIAGSLLALSVGYISPDAYGPSLSIDMFAAVMIGGAARWWGPVLGAMFVVMIPELTQATQNLGAIVYAALFLAISTLYPGGIQQFASSLGMRKTASTR